MPRLPRFPALAALPTEPVPPKAIAAAALFIPPKLGMLAGNATGPGFVRAGGCCPICDTTDGHVSGIRACGIDGNGRNCRVGLKG